MKREIIAKILIVVFGVIAGFLPQVWNSAEAQTWDGVGKPIYCCVLNRSPKCQFDQYIYTDKPSSPACHLSMSECESSCGDPPTLKTFYACRKAPSSGCGYLTAQNLTDCQKQTGSACYTDPNCSGACNTTFYYCPASGGSCVATNNYSDATDCSNGVWSSGAGKNGIWCQAPEFKAQCDSQCGAGGSGSGSGSGTGSGSGSGSGGATNRSVYSCVGSNNSCALLGQTTDSLATCQSKVGKPCFEDSNCNGSCGTSGSNQTFYACRKAPSSGCGYLTAQNLTDCQKQTGSACYTDPNCSGACNTTFYYCPASGGSCVATNNYSDATDCSNGVWSSGAGKNGIWCQEPQYKSQCDSQCGADCNKNFYCDAGETNANCPSDCPCNFNGVCEAYLGENSTNCIQDCSCNQNNICEAQRGESYSNCSSDCQYTSGKVIVKSLPVEMNNPPDGLMMNGELVDLGGIAVLDVGFIIYPEGSTPIMSDPNNTYSVVRTNVLNGPARFALPAQNAFFYGFPILPKFQGKNRLCYKAYAMDANGGTIDKNQAVVFGGEVCFTVPQKQEIVCGNGSCESGENYQNCPADCPKASVCGDGKCESDEILSCPKDCNSAVCAIHTAGVGGSTNAYGFSLRGRVDDPNNTIYKNAIFGFEIYNLRNGKNIFSGDYQNVAVTCDATGGRDIPKYCDLSQKEFVVFLTNGALLNSSMLSNAALGDTVCARAFMSSSVKDYTKIENRIYANSSEDICWVLSDKQVSWDKYGFSTCGSKCSNVERPGCSGAYTPPVQERPMNCVNSGLGTAAGVVEICSSVIPAAGCNRGDVLITLEPSSGATVNYAKVYLTLYSGRGIKFISDYSDSDYKAQVFGENIFWDVGKFSQKVQLRFQVSFPDGQNNQLVNYTFGKNKVYHGCNTAGCNGEATIYDMILSPKCGVDICRVDGICDVAAGETLENCSSDCKNQVCNSDGKCDLGKGETFINCPKDCGQFKNFAVITLDAKDITDHSATIRGTIPGMGDVETAQYYLSYYICDAKARDNLHLGQSYIAASGQTKAGGLFEAKLDYLFPGMKYCFEASAYDVDNKNNMLAGGQKEFTTLAPSSGINCPNLSSPINSAKIQTLTPELKWASASGATYYRYAIFKDFWNMSAPSEANGVIVPNAKVAPNSLIWARQYIWAVNACKDSTMKECSGWCMPSSFITGDLLAPPKIIRPSGDITSIQPLIEWEYVSGGNYYEWVIERESPALGIPKVAETGLTKEKTASATKNLALGNYLIKVRACSDQQMVICGEYAEAKFSVKTDEQLKEKCGTLRISSTSSKEGYFMMCANGKAWPCDDGALSPDYPVNGKSDYLYDRAIELGLTPGEFRADYYVNTAQYDIYLQDKVNGTKYPTGSPLPSNHKEYKLIVDPLKVPNNTLVEKSRGGGGTYNVPADMAQDVLSLYQSGTPEIKAKVADQLPIYDGEKELEWNLDEMIFGFIMDNPLFKPGLAIDGGNYFDINKDSAKGEISVTIKDSALNGSELDKMQLLVAIPQLNTFQTINNLWYNQGCLDAQEVPQVLEYTIGPPVEDCKALNCASLQCAVAPECSYNDGEKVVVNRDQKTDYKWNLYPDNPASGRSLICRYSGIDLTMPPCDPNAPPKQILGFSDIDYCSYPVIVNFNWEPSQETPHTQKAYTINIKRKDGKDWVPIMNYFNDDPVTGGSNVKSIKVFGKGQATPDKGEIEFTNREDSDRDLLRATLIVRAENGLESEASDPVEFILPAQPRPIPVIPVDGPKKYVANPETRQITFYGELNADQQSIGISVPDANSWNWYKGLGEAVIAEKGEPIYGEEGAIIGYRPEKTYPFRLREPIEVRLEFLHSDTINDKNCSAPIKLIEGTDVIFRSKGPQI